MAKSSSDSETLRSVLHEISNNDEEGKAKYNITDLEHPSNKGAFRKIPTNQIYKETMLSSVNLLSDYKIKTFKVEFTLTKAKKDIYLRSRDAIRKHRSKYNHIHIGLVQVGIAGLHRRGIEASLLICLRDTKNPIFKDSILAAFESTVCDGVIMFNWFPNYSSPLSDLLNNNGLAMTVEPIGYNLAKGYEERHILALTYDICYQLMKTNPDPKSLFESPILEVNVERTNVTVPKIRNSYVCHGPLILSDLNSSVKIV